MYRNYRCRKCNRYLSIETKLNLTRHPQLGILILSDYTHPNCHINEDEKVLADLVSESKTPIPETSFVYNWDEENHKYIFENKENE